MGVYVGISYNEYGPLVAATTPAISAYTATGSSLSVAAGMQPAWGNTFVSPRTTATPFFCGTVWARWGYLCSGFSKAPALPPDAFKGVVHLAPLCQLFLHGIWRNATAEPA